jgi:hypothetical protein
MPNNHPLPAPSSIPAVCWSKGRDAHEQRTCQPSNQPPTDPESVLNAPRWRLVCSSACAHSSNWSFFLRAMEGNVLSSPHFARMLGGDLLGEEPPLQVIPTLEHNGLAPLLRSPRGAAAAAGAAAGAAGAGPLAGQGGGSLEEQVLKHASPQLALHIVHSRVSWPAVALRAVHATHVLQRCSGQGRCLVRLDTPGLVTEAGKNANGTSFAIARGPGSRCHAMIALWGLRACLARATPLQSLQSSPCIHNANQQNASRTHEARVSGTRRMGSCPSLHWYGCRASA